MDSDGTDGLICWTGGIGYKVLEAAKLLRIRGLHPKLISIPSLIPAVIEEMLLNNPKKLVLTVEEHSLTGGFGSLVLEVASGISFPGKIVRIGIPESVNKEIGSHEYLLQRAGLSPNAISEKFELEILKHQTR